MVRPWPAPAEWFRAAWVWLLGQHGRPLRVEVLCCVFCVLKPHKWWPCVPQIWPLFFGLPTNMADVFSVEIKYGARILTAAAQCSVSFASFSHRFAANHDRLPRPRSTSAAQTAALYMGIVRHQERRGCYTRSAHHMLHGSSDPHDPHRVVGPTRDGGAAGRHQRGIQ